MAILDTGLGAMWLVRQVNCRYSNITVENPRNSFLFPPMVLSSTIGTGISAALSSQSARYRSSPNYQVACNTIDPGPRRIHGETMCVGYCFELRYARLFVAAGANIGTVDIPRVSGKFYHVNTKISEPPGFAYHDRVRPLWAPVLRYQG